MGDVSLLRGPGSGYSCGTVAVAQMLRGGDISKRIGRDGWWLQLGTGVACLRNGCACTFEGPQKVSASGGGSLDALMPTLTYGCQGIGSLLMEEAERISRDEHGSGRIAVISGKSDEKP